MRPQDAFYLARSAFRINGRDRRQATQGAVGAFEPARGAFATTQAFIGNRHDAGQPVKPVGFVTRQPSTTTVTLETSRR